MLIILTTFFIFFVYQVNSEDSSGLLNINDEIESNLIGFTYKFFEIRGRNYDIDLTFSIGRNESDLTRDSINNGDIIEFYITKDLSEQGMDISEPTSDTNIWQFIKTLTSNDDTAYDSYLNGKNGDKKRRIGFKHTIPSVIPSGNDTLKVKIIGYLCNSNSGCQFVLKSVKKEAKWVWILVGVLIGVIILCGVITAILYFVKNMFLKTRDYKERLP